MDESLSFPNGKYDDQVDATTIALDAISRQVASPEALDWDIDISGSLNNRWQDISKDSINSKFGPKFKGWGM